MDETSEYVCPHCGESIQIVVDASAGSVQDYVEDCPVCCNPNQLRIMFDREGYASIQVEPS